MARALVNTLPLGQPAKNYIINGGFDLWQRGTSFASAGTAVYTADRWYQFSVSGATTSLVAATGTTSRYGIKLARNSGQTFLNSISLAQPQETANIQLLRGKLLTVSFWAKAGANFSATGSLLNIRMLTGTGAEGKHIGGSFTGPVYQIAVSKAITTTMTRYTIVSATPIPTNATQLELFFEFTPTGTAGADDSVTIEQVMLNEGSAAAPFALAGGDIEGELRKCQRYCEVAVSIGATTLSNFGTASTSAHVYFPVTFNVAKRAAPTEFLSSAASAFAATDTSSGPTLTGISLGGFTSARTGWVAGVSTGLTQFRPYVLYGAAAGTFVLFGAEL